ncbi:MAG: protein kinase [Ignavibacteria bacterium]|nr:protein kinase [Ignavibacteria bacterium]
MIGSTISHYTILEKLGGGGMGVVYKAQDLKLKRTVALKFLPPDLTRDEDAKTRFVHEAQAASALQHNNICNVHDIDETKDGQTFIVMDCYEGQSLKQVIERGPLPIDEAIGIATQVAQGLAKAHENGIVHRDIKPANVMLTTDGVAKIVDFGLAKLSGRTVLTKSGSTVGTAAYMSPEQARGEAVDARTDIWSLGVVMYEMLTGKRPFDSEYEQALVYSILSQDPKPMRELRPEVPEALEKICRRAMAKDTKDRYQTAAELIADFESYKVGTQLSQQTRKVLKKKHSLLYAAAVCAVVAIAAIFFYTQSSGKVFDSIAVLPFENLSADTTRSFFSQGLANEIIDRMWQVSSLRVPSLKTVMAKVKPRMTYAEMAKELGVKAILQARIQQDGSRLKISAALMDPDADRPLWSKTFERDFSNILTLQSELAQAIVENVRVNVSQDEQQRLGRSQKTVNPQAYELYLRARQEMTRLPLNPTKSGWDSAMAKLHVAIDIEPDNALYYASLASGYGWAAGWTLVPTTKLIPKMKAAAEKALGLDPDLAESQLSAAVVDVYQYNFKSAQSRTSRALELSPGNFSAHLARGGLLVSTARLEQALVMYQRAQALDPVQFKAGGFGLGFIYFFMRRYDDAIAAFKELMRDDPKSDVGHAFLALAYSMKGMHAEALAHNDSTHYWGVMIRPPLLVRAGKRSLGMNVFERDRSKINSLSKAGFFALLGEKDSAFQWLQRAYQDRGDIVVWLQNDPFLDTLRDDPRYRELLKAMNLDGKKN